jgi:ribosome-associated protein
LPLLAGYNGGMNGIKGPGFIIPESELGERFIRAPGPGGQNVNKVSSCVQLTFDLTASPSLAEPVKLRLAALLGSRLSKEGVLLLTASRFRTRERNRADARERLAALVARAITPPKKRRPTKVPKTSKKKRLESKKHRSRMKARRSGWISE